MATRFYLPAEGSGAPAVSPAFDAGWEQTGQATRLNLLYKNTLTTLSTIASNGTRTIPITTTQDILCNQFVSPPLFDDNQLIDTSCLFSLVISCVESVATANAFLAVVVKAFSPDGGTSRGTLFSTFSSDTEFGITTSTRLVNQNALTSAVSVKAGDILVVEIGARGTAPTTSGTYTMIQGTSAASDFALTSGLTTSLNPWCEFSNNLFPAMSNNFQSVEAGNGISSSGGVR